MQLRKNKLDALRHRRFLISFVGSPPTKQARRAERRGITRAVSPKKIGERKKGNVPLAQEHRGEEKTGERSERFEERDRSPVKVADDGLEHRLRR